MIEADKEPSAFGWIAKSRDKIRDLQSDLQAEGIAFFPTTRQGEYAHRLWRRIRQHLFRGGAVQITISVLGLDWHRQELKRARNVLVEIGLIKPRPDGLYVLGRYDWLDEEVRERFSGLKAVEEMLIALSGIINTVKNPDAA